MNYDIIVIGGGPGGYVAAIRAAQLGFKTACVEMATTLGGTCLNVGCIPSKALLESTALYEKAQHDFAAHGIHADNVSLDTVAMMARKNDIVQQLTDGIAQLFKANKIDWIAGRGRLLPHKTVEITASDGSKQQIQATRGVILAAGSLPIDIPVAKMDGENIVSSSEALAFTQAPQCLGIIGAGVIGLEMGSVWRAAGSEVIILEAMENLLSMADAQLSREALKILKTQGLDIRLGAKVNAATVEKNGVLLQYSDKNGEQQLKVDKLLVAVGRKPNTADLIDSACNVKRDARGYIEVDEHCATGEAGVYAIGDCVRGPMLAHKASEEGVMVAEILAGQAGHVRYDLIPSVIYTHPEMAWIGRGEEQLKSEGVAYKKGDFPFIANGRAKAIGMTQGFVKILTDAESDEILGAHIIGANASELIHELLIAMEFYAAGEDVARSMHAHPTLAEAIHEAALAIEGQAIHKANQKRR
ncbi:MAG: dihydrolipoyl dehydrogenase [Cardiobacteriaceae bacterium]|nr:dihydrolipoyl dehydrogenase [Cardiobacteriaceae bacterium]